MRCSGRVNHLILNLLGDVKMCVQNTLFFFKLCFFGWVVCSKFFFEIILSNNESFILLIFFFRSFFFFLILVTLFLRIISFFLCWFLFLIFFLLVIRFLLFSFFFLFFNFFFLFGWIWLRNMGVQLPTFTDGFVPMIAPCTVPHASDKTKEIWASFIDELFERALHAIFAIVNAKYKGNVTEGHKVQMIGFVPEEKLLLSKQI